MVARRRAVVDRDANVRFRHRRPRRGCVAATNSRPMAGMLHLRQLSDNAFEDARWLQTKLSSWPVRQALQVCGICLTYTSLDDPTTTVVGR
jgi:hypothetical protein